MIICLCACGAKKQQLPTAAPTEIPAGPAAESTPEADEKSADTSQSTNEKSSSIEAAEEKIRELQAVGEQMDASAAFIVLDTAGKSVWKAPLAGIEEFKVPDFILDAHGSLRSAQQSLASAFFHLRYRRKSG